MASSFLRSTGLVVILAFSAALPAKADVLAEFLFWDAMGNAAGQAMQSYSDYKRERQSWRDNAARAKAELDKCGGCASAKAELEKWQRTENQFQEVAGSIFASVGMPSIVADALDIRMPMAPMRSEAERARECAVSAPSWAKDRPDFCRQAVAEHTSCVQNFQAAHGICSARSASVEGNACWDSSKLVRACAAEDYESFEREKAAQAYRREHASAPEYIDYGTEKLVLYPHAPAGFVPPVPPRRVVEGLFSDKDFRHVWMMMQDRRHGELKQVSIAPFFWPQVAPTSDCFSGKEIANEIEKRICSDLTELNWRWTLPVLACRYEGEPRDVVYWLGERPEAAAKERLLQRASNHPALKVGDPRDACPATLAKAREIADAYDRQLASLGVSEVPEAQVLSRSEWQEARQKAYDEQRYEGIREKLRAFPLAGYYTLSRTIWHSLKKRNSAGGGSCTVEAVENHEDRYDIACIDRRKGIFSGRAAMVREGFLVDWSYGEKIVFEVSREASPPLLFGTRPGDPSGKYTESLQRMGDRSPEAFSALMAEFPMADGHYEIAFTRQGDAFSLSCDLERDKRRTPGDFKLDCTDEAGATMAAKLIPKSDGLQAYLDMTSWYPTRPRVGGKQAIDIAFPLDLDDMPKGGVDALDGTASNEIVVRLERKR